MHCKLLFHDLRIKCSYVLQKNSYFICQVVEVQFEYNPFLNDVNKLSEDYYGLIHTWLTKSEIVECVRLSVYFTDVLFFVLTGRVLPTESKRKSIKILLKAASYFECALKAVLPNTPEDTK